MEEWTEEEGQKCPTIRAVIHVDSKSQKPIILGKGGEKLKEIGIESRKDVEKLLGHQVCLKLHVNVEQEWKRDRRQIKNYLELDQ